MTLNNIEQHLPSREAFPISLQSTVIGLADQRVNYLDLKAKWFLAVALSRLERDAITNVLMIYPTQHLIVRNLINGINWRYVRTIIVILVSICAY